MMAVLILNPDCSISALCEIEQYFSFQYQEQGCVVMRVETDCSTFVFIHKTMWQDKRNVYVIPSNTECPARFFEKVEYYVLCDLNEVPVLKLPF